jgi:5'-3' exonuclease
MHVQLTEREVYKAIAAYVKEELGVDTEDALIIIRVDGVATSIDGAEVYTKKLEGK